MKQLRSKTIISLQIVILFIWTIGIALPVQAGDITSTVKEEHSIADGIKYKDIRMTYIEEEEEVDDSEEEPEEINQALRLMEIDISNPLVSVELGIPSPLNKLGRTTSLALSHNHDDVWAAGAINASFFHSRMPMNLLSTNNRLIHSGEVFEGNDKYVTEPIAFGIDQNGKGMIDHFNLTMEYIHDGQIYPITATNKPRFSDETILYTSSYPSEHTEANQYGTEVVVTMDYEPTYEFGSAVEGTVERIRERGDNESKTEIPDNGFVLSGNGIGSENLEQIATGDTISLVLDIDDHWKQSSFMIASGPMLVDNGQAVWRKEDTEKKEMQQRHPRTAIAIDETGQKVFFVTVDGRQKGYSNGMDLEEFAQHLVDLGAYRALNLDGGGSTTMGARLPGYDKITVANQPAYGYERQVSAIIMALSSDELQIFKDVKNDHWAIDAIENLFKKGTITGFPGGEFRPGETITRTQAAIMLTREFGLDTREIEDPEYDDVSEEDQYYKEIAAATNAGFFKGTGDGKFNQNGQLTRAEMAVLLQRAFNVENTDKIYYPDVEESHWAYQAINAITDAGISTGLPGGIYGPENDVTRAEFSQFIVRAQPEVTFLTVKDIGTDGLRVRSEANTNSDVLGAVYSFDSIPVYLDTNGNPIKDGDWYKIMYEGQSAWVHGDYIE